MLESEQRRPNKPEADTIDVNLLSLLMPERPAGNMAQQELAQTRAAFRSTNPTDGEVQMLNKVATRDQIKQIKQEINTSSDDPQTAIMDLAAKHRLLCAGDEHLKLNAFQSLITVMAPKLAQQAQRAGMKPYFISGEIEQKYQSWLDNIETAPIPNDWKKMDPSLTSSYVEMLKALKKAGFTLKAADTRDFPDKTLPSTHPENIKFRNENSTMVTDKVLSDPKVKAWVLYSAGGHHVEKSDGDAGDSAAQMLQRLGIENGYSVGTLIAASAGPEEAPDRLAASVFADSIGTAVAVQLNKTNVLKTLSEAFDSTNNKLHRGVTLSDIDLLLILPRDYSLQLYEKAYGANSKDIIPLLDRYCQAYIGWGEYDKAIETARRSLAIEKKVSDKQTESLNERYKVLAKAMATKAYHLLQEGKLNESLDAYAELFTQLEQAPAVPSVIEPPTFTSDPTPMRADPLNLDWAIRDLQQSCAQQGKQQELKGLAIFERLTNYRDSKIAPTESHFEDDFRRLAERFETQNDNVKAEFYFRKRTDLAEHKYKLDPKTQIVFIKARQELLDFFVRHKDLAKIREVADKNLDFIESSPSFIIVLGSYLPTSRDIGKLFLENQNKEAAVHFFQRTLKMAKMAVSRDYISAELQMNFIQDCAKALRNKGYKDEAEKLLQEAK